MKHLVPVALAFSLAFVVFACNDEKGPDADVNKRYALIPYPQTLAAHDGNFTLSEETKIVTHGSFEPEVKLLQALLKQATGKTHAVTNDAGENTIELVTDTTLTHGEAYTLDVTNSNIRIKAKTGTGIFRAIETLRQLLPAEIEGNGAASATVKIPNTSVTDFPKYDWRGMHLDVSRHFFSIDYLKKFIDLLALYKFNKLHLHSRIASQVFYILPALH